MKKVLMLSATWCGPCQQSKPVFNSLKESFQDVEFEVVDIEQNQDAAKRFNIGGIPTFIVLENGVEVNRFVGGQNVTKLKEVL